MKHILHIYVHSLSISISIYMCIYICVCVCMLDQFDFTCSFSCPASQQPTATGITATSTG